MIDRTRKAVSGIAGPRPCRPHLTRLAFLVTAAFFASTPAARAQLRTELRTQSDLSPPQIQEIQAYVQGLTDKLVDPSADHHVAREDLIHNAAQPAGQQLSGAFLDNYAECVNDSLIKAFDRNPPENVRLNIAIVAAKVANLAGNARLRAMTQRLLDDHSEAVVLWGLKAAQGILPTFLSVPSLASDSTLIRSIVSATKRFPNDGDIARTAYVALSPTENGLPAEEQQSIVSHVVPPLQELLQSRVEVYKTGIPSDPTAEIRAVDFLSEKGNWAMQSAPQQLQTMQLLLNLQVAVAQRASAASGDDRDLLIDILQKCAGALEVTAQNKSPALATAVGPKLDALHDVTSRTGPQDLIDKTAAAVKAMVDNMPELKAPPDLAIPATGPATTQAATPPG